MCSIMGAIAGISGIMGTFASASAQSQSISAQNRANEYNAIAAQNNATLSAQQAQDARDRAKEDAKMKGMEVAKVMGTQKTRYNASGVELAGSAEQVIGDTAFWGEYDKNTILNNGEKEAWGYEMQQTNYLNQANMYRANKQNNSVFGSILSGMTSVGMGLATTYRNT